MAHGSRSPRPRLRRSPNNRFRNTRLVGGGAWQARVTARRPTPAAGERNPGSVDANAVIIPSAHPGRHLEFNRTEESSHRLHPQTAVAC